MLLDVNRRLDELELTFDQVAIDRLQLGSGMDSEADLEVIREFIPLTRAAQAV